MSHSRARLNAFGRQPLITRIEAGWPVRAAASAGGISHTRAYVLRDRYRVEGPRGADTFLGHSYGLGIKVVQNEVGRTVLKATCDKSGSCVWRPE